MNRRAGSLACAFGSRHCILGLVLAFVSGAATAQPKTGAASGPAAEQWITVNKDYSSQRYVDLDQITPANVSGLTQVCEIQLNEPAWFNSGLLMFRRTIVATTQRSTYALDAATCALRWRHDIEFKASPMTNSNRGAAYLDGTVFRGTGDGRVIALDAGSGKLVWQTQGADPTRLESFLSAPVAWDGKVFIGIAISDMGIRGRQMAFDAKSGKELWRFNTIPIGNEPGAETWANQFDPLVPPGGGGFWASYSLDPATGEVFGPVANPFPDYLPGLRRGANLYTNSVIALNAATGALNWYYQAVAADDHDWDLGTAPTLYRTPSGKSMLAVAGKDGLVHGVDRTTKAVVFKTPGTTIANTAPLDDTFKRVCPGSLGGAQWNGAAYHPGLGMLYAGMVDRCFYYSARTYTADRGFWTGGEDVEGTMRDDFSRPPRGWITAMDGESGRVLWKLEADAPVVAGLVPTRGGLLFGGDVRGNLLALDARSGVVLKRIDAKGALNNGLISYAVDGVQYVAAGVGGVTLNAVGVSGPLRVSVYGLAGSGTPKVVKLDRGPIMPVPATGAEANAKAFGSFCGSCHSVSGKHGGVAPPVVRHTQLGDPATLKAFLAAVPPPMPILYPGILEDKDVEMIAAYLKTLAAGTNAQLPNGEQMPTSAYVQSTSEGSKAWQAIYSVFTSPRCINCHTSSNTPRQTDMRYPHVYAVVRGADDKGTPVARCSACHGAANNALTGVPGAKDWHTAPLSMTLESAPGVAKTGAHLCGTIKDRLRNGNRDLADLIAHVDTDPLILWTWQPGTRWNGEARTTPPISHQEFVAAMKEWASAGAACPH